MARPCVPVRWIGGFVVAGLRLFVIASVVLPLLKQPAQAQGGTFDCTSITNNCATNATQQQICNNMCSQYDQSSVFCPLGCDQIFTSGSSYSACLSYCNLYCYTKLGGIQICLADLAPSLMQTCKDGCGYGQTEQQCCSVTCPVCQNGGTCSSANPRTYCNCPSGYSGNTCNTYTVQCPTQNPCQNNGTCVNQAGNASYYCVCTQEYQGTLCQTATNPCNTGSPCQNGGICNSHTPGAFTCTCPLDYATDSTCSQRATNCPTPNPCINNGSCAFVNGSVTCQCPKGVTGDRCETDLRMCPYVNCRNGGVCLEAVNGTGTFQCQCQTGYSGTYCTNTTMVIPDTTPGNNTLGLAIGLGVAIPLVVIIFIIMILLVVYYRRRYRNTGKPSPLPGWAIFGYTASFQSNSDLLMMSSPEKSVSKGALDHTGQTTVVSEFAIALPGYLQLDYAKDLRVDYQLSNGGGGVIYAGTLMNPTIRDHSRLKMKNEEVVIKHVPDRKDMSPQDNELMFEQEISTMAALSMYPNIVTLVGYTTMPRCIVMPLHKAGDLYSLVNKPSVTFHVLQLTEIALDIATGMSAIHGIGVVHRDLKTPNCLIEIEQRATPAATKMFGPRYKALITDFGVCRVRESSVSINGQVFLNVFGLSYRYAPPEVFSRAMLKQNKEVPFDEECKADVYAFAICMWELLTRQIPWNKTSKDEIQRRVMAGERPALSPTPMTTTGDERLDRIYSALHSLTITCWDQEHFRRPLFSTTRAKLEDLIAAFLQELTVGEQQVFNVSSQTGTASAGGSLGTPTSPRLQSPPPSTGLPQPAPRIKHVPTASGEVSQTGTTSQSEPPRTRPAALPKPPAPVPYSPYPTSSSAQANDGHDDGSLKHGAAAATMLMTTTNIVKAGNNVRLQSKHSYTAAKADELSFEPGQVFVLLQRNHDGWYRVRDTTTNQEGWVPGNYLEDCVSVAN